MLSELTRKGKDFCLPGIALMELPVISFQVKPDRFEPPKPKRTTCTFEEKQNTR